FTEEYSSVELRHAADDQAWIAVVDGAACLADMARQVVAFRRAQRHAAAAIGAEFHPCYWTGSPRRRPVLGRGRTSGHRDLAHANRNRLRRGTAQPAESDTHVSRAPMRGTGALGLAARLARQPMAEPRGETSPITSCPCTRSCLMSHLCRRPVSSIMNWRTPGRCAKCDANSRLISRGRQKLECHSRKHAAS